jgi:menaquinone-9 beta-reductase
VLSSQHRTDVFVIGGGPAGLAAAIAARQKGLSVILADGAAPPIEKPCGEGMMPETLAALRALGMEIRPSEAQRLRGISFVQEDAEVFADFPDEQGIGMRRPLLHQRLVARAEECGVQLLWRTPVRGIDAQGVQLANQKILARWIIGADGQGSRFRRWSGLDETRRRTKRHATRQHFRVRPWSEYTQFFWGTHVQAYSTPVGPKEVCIVVMSELPEYADFDRALQELPQLQNHLRDAQFAGRERGAISVMHTLRNVQRGNFALIGDAAGGIDAITGEGLRLAFRQALALAEAMLAGDLTQYEQAYRDLLRRPMLMGHLMLWLGRHPRIRAHFLRTMQSNPSLFARLVAAHAGEGGPADLLTTGASLGWRLLAT